MKIPHYQYSFSFWRCGRSEFITVNQLQTKLNITNLQLHCQNSLKLRLFFTGSLCKHLKQTRFCLPYYKSFYEGLWFKVTEQNPFSFLRPYLKEWLGWTFQFLNSSSKNLDSRRWKFKYPPRNCFLLNWFLQR